jgi:lauroyl/myristoyl acyltransferase
VRIDLERLMNGRLGVRLAAWLVRAIPARLENRICSLAGNWIASRRDSGLVRAVRLNQWVVRGESLSKDELDEAVRETFRNSARTVYDLYRHAGDLEKVGEMILLDEVTQELVQRPEFDRQGLVVVGLHVSNFDLILQWLCRQGIRPLVLTIPDPQGGRRVEYEARLKTGMNLVPASLGALRHAIRHLQQGGCVLTGADRPVPEPRERPLFFGRPAALPTHHVYLAAKAGVPVRVMFTRREADGRYRVTTSAPIAMDSYDDWDAGMLKNTEKVLKVAETYLRGIPQQWSVPLPLWPEVLPLVPA